MGFTLIRLIEGYWILIQCYQESWLQANVASSESLASYLDFKILCVKVICSLVACLSHINNSELASIYITSGICCLV